ncbi:hypothetical protein TNCV_724111 [Trichonephila clavipes]|nr:hypothetical protein TNCV_724111 [Trichonephila clavipes]
MFLVIRILVGTVLIKIAEGLEYGGRGTFYHKKKFNALQRVRIPKKFGDSYPMNEDDWNEFMTVFDNKEVETAEVEVQLVTVDLTLWPEHHFCQGSPPQKSHHSVIYRHQSKSPPSERRMFRSEG